MKRSYETGMDSASIQLEVKIGTVGVAYTAVYLSGKGGQWNMLDESNINNGNIPNFHIGEAKHLHRYYIVIRTMVDFGHLSEKERNAAVHTIFAAYLVSGGYSGSQNYNYDNDDITITPDNKSVLIIKAIEML